MGVVLVEVVVPTTPKVEYNFVGIFFVVVDSGKATSRGTRLTSPLLLVTHKTKACFSEYLCNESGRRVRRLNQVFEV